MHLRPTSVPDTVVFQHTPPQPTDLVSRAGVRAPLKPHQINGVQWMIHREGTVGTWGRLLGREYALPLVLATDLLPYAHERREPRGGFLCDDMGLGKTLSFVALTMVSHVLDTWCAAHTQHTGNRPGPTLVVAPRGLLEQWKEEIMRFTTVPPDDILIFHPDHERVKRITTEQIRSKTFVLTNFEFLTRKLFPHGVKRDPEPSRCVLFQVQWNRVGIDEGHMARKPTTGSFRALTALQTKRCWEITGTPFQNAECDLGCLSDIVHVPHPFPPFKKTSRKSLRPQIPSRATREQEQKWRQEYVLRRTKDELKDEGLLPDFPTKHVHTVPYTLTHAETETYSTMEAKWEILYRQWKQARPENKSKAYMEILTHLMRMRQVVDDPLLCFGRSLTLPLSRDRADLVLSMNRHVCFHCRENIPLPDNDDGAADADDWFEPDESTEHKHTTATPRVTIDDDDEKDDHGNAATTTNRPPFFLREMPCRHRVCESCDRNPAVLSRGERCRICMHHMNSSRTEAILRILQAVPAGEKTVIFSQWTSYLDLLEWALVRAGISYVRMDGDVSDPAARKRIRERFNDPTGDIRVFLGSTKAGGLGLNLVAADHLIYADKWFNPYVGRQAVDRIYRIGQTRDVHIYHPEPHLFDPTVATTHMGPMASIDMWLDRLQMCKVSRGDQILDGMELSGPAQQLQRQEEESARSTALHHGDRTNESRVTYTDDVEIANMIFGNARQRREIAAKRSQSASALEVEPEPETTTTLLAPPMVARKRGPDATSASSPPTVASSRKRGRPPTSSYSSSSSSSSAPHEPQPLSQEEMDMIQRALDEADGIPTRATVVNPVLPTAFVQPHVPTFHSLLPQAHSPPPPVKTHTISSPPPQTPIALQPVPSEPSLASSMSRIDAQRQRYVDYFSHRCAKKI